MTLPCVVILSTADYDAAVWTNKQHIAARLAEYTQVRYVNSLGLRRPTASLADVKRILARLTKALGRHSSQDDHPRPCRLNVHSPTVIPLHQWMIVQRLNRLLLRRQLRQSIPEGDVVLWTFSPMTYGIEDLVDRVVYHSVDLLHAIPGVPRDAVLKHERALVSTADRVIASSDGVRDHLMSLGRRDVDLWHNVADTALFGASSATGRKRRRRAMFAGNLTPSKIDLDLLTALSRSGVPVAIAGPAGIDGQREQRHVESLLNQPNVAYLGNLPPSALARELQESMVGLIPYLDNEYTAGVFPMKLYEYLSAGLAVVSTPLRSFRGQQTRGLTVTSSSEFVSTVQSALSAFDEEEAEARTRGAEAHSWDSRLTQVVELLRSEAITRVEVSE